MKDSKKSYPGKYLKQAIKYITDKTKTDNGRLVSGINCQPSLAYEQMMKTKELFSKTDKRQGYHMIISFVEDEVTADEAFKIIGEFANEYLGKEYEALDNVDAFMMMTDYDGRPDSKATANMGLDKGTPNFSKSKALLPHAWEVYKDANS